MSKIFEKGREHLSNEELQEIIDESYEQWDKTNTVFSLSDFEEAIIELTKREI